MDRAALFRVGSHSGLTVRHAAWETACDCLATIADPAPRTFALLGPSGVGKTLLLRELTQTLADTELVSLRGREDQIPADLGSTPDQVVLIDDADEMDTAALESLVRHGSARLVLAGPPSLGERLKALSPQVVIVPLAPLARTEVAGFLAGLFIGAGESPDLLSKQAIERIGLYASGVPRALSSITRTACMLACSEGATRVEGPHVDVAVAVLEEGGKAPLRLPNPAVYALFSAAQSGDEADRRSDLEPATSLLDPGSDGPDLGAAERSGPEGARPDGSPIVSRRKRLPLMLAAGSLAAGVALSAFFWTDAALYLHLPFVGARASIPSEAALAAGAPAVDARMVATTAARMPQAGTPQAPTENAPPGLQQPTPTATQGNTQPANRPDPSEARPQGEGRMLTGAPASERSEPGQVVVASLSPTTDTGQEVQPATLALPAMAPVRVTLTYPRGDVSAEQQAARTAAILRAAAIATADPVPVSASSAKPGIGYFYFEDRAAANAVERVVGSQLGGSGLVVRQREERPPPPGTIEVYVPGRDKVIASARAGRPSANVADR
jgi:AAA ATPase domain